MGRGLLPHSYAIVLLLLYCANLCSTRVSFDLQKSSALREPRRAVEAEAATAVVATLKSSEQIHFLALLAYTLVIILTSSVSKVNLVAVMVHFGSGR